MGAVKRRLSSLTTFLQSWQERKGKVMGYERLSYYWCTSCVGWVEIYQYTEPDNDGWCPMCGARELQATKPDEFVQGK